jgi:membrane protease YdiL (CAAX protease family)
MDEQDSTGRPSPAPAGALDSPALDVPLARPVPWAAPMPPATPRDALRLGNLPRSAAWFDLVVLIVGLVGLDIMVQEVLLRAYGIDTVADDRLPPEVTQQLLTATVALRAALSFLLVGILLKARRQGREAVGLGGARWAFNGLLAIPVAAVAGGLCYAVLFLIVAIWPDVLHDLGENADRLRELVPRLSPAGYAALMLIVGFYEELLFRGFLMPRLRRALGGWTAAVAVSTVLFTAPHALDQSWIALVPITVLSLVFSVTTIWRGSIVPAVGAHAMFNLSQILLMEYAAGNS